MEKKTSYSKPYQKTAKTLAYKPKRGKLAPLMTEEEIVLDDNLELRTIMGRYENNYRNS